MDLKVKQGDIWWIDPTPKIGAEQRGRRPALIIQNNIANQYLHSTIIVIISSSGKTQMPEMVNIGSEYGLKENSYADFAQIFTIDKGRLMKKIGNIGENKWVEIEKALSSIFYKTIN